MPRGRKSEKQMSREQKIKEQEIKEQEIKEQKINEQRIEEPVTFEQLKDYIRNMPENEVLTIIFEKGEENGSDKKDSGTL